MRSIYLKVLIIGIGVGISIACADLWIAISFQPSDLSLFRSLLLPLSITTFLCMIVYLNLAFLFARQGTSELLGAVASFEAVSFLSLTYLRISKGLFALKMIPWILIIFIISLGFAAGVFHFLQKVFAREKMKQMLLTLAAAMPFLLIELMTYQWFEVFSISKKHFSPFLLIFIFSAIFALTIFLVHRMSMRVRMLSNVVLGIVVLIGPLVTLGFARDPIARNSNIKSHQIKHIILITIDALRADSLTGNGGTGIMPNVRKLANDGIEWKNAYSTAPWTLPSIVSIMTGHTPLTHLASRGVNRKVPRSLPTLAECMRDAGYSTAAIGENPVLVKESLRRGFDRYEMFPKSRLNVSTGTKILSTLFPDSYRIKTSRDHMNQLIANWINNNSRSDFFLWVHFFDPHCPYEPPSRFLPPATGSHLTNLVCLNKIRPGIFSPSKQDRIQIHGLYSGEVRSVDEQVAKLLSNLKRSGIYEDSLIILAADHGEEFWEHGGFEHGHCLYNEVIKVPLIVKLPHSSRKGVVESPVSTEAIFPTILQIAGIPHKDDCLPSSLLKSPSEISPAAFIATAMLYYEPKAAVIRGDYKYILNRTTGAEELYDLRTDPGERNSLVSEDNQQLDSMRKDLQEIEKKAQEQRKKHRIIPEEELLDKDSKERLQALGYLN